MGWKTINGNRYYYRSKRDGGRVRSPYCGTGDQALIFALLDDEKRREREAVRDAERAERAAAEAEERAVSAWFTKIEAVANAALFAAGFHRHDRGPWRRRRMANQMKAIGRAQAPPWSDRKAVDALIERGHEGDKAAFPQLRALFADPARDAAILDAYGSPPLWLEHDLSTQAGGKSQTLQAAIHAKLAEVRRDLEGPAPTPTERLLAERAAACWFLVNRYESVYATAKDLSPRQADFHQRRIDRAHARFLSALKTLATIRKLAIPALQVNIGANQVNTAGHVGP